MRSRRPAAVLTREAGRSGTVRPGMMSSCWRAIAAYARSGNFDKRGMVSRFRFWSSDSHFISSVRAISPHYIFVGVLLYAQARVDQGAGQAEVATHMHAVQISARRRST